jgi:hypothetical protein
MKNTIFAALLSVILLSACSGNDKKDDKDSGDSTKTTSGPAMKPGDRTSDGGH